MEKWEKQLGEISNKPVPKIVEQRITETLNLLPEKRRFTKVKYASLVAVLILSLLFGASLINPAFAETLKSLPLISTVTEFIDDISMKNGHDKGIADSLDQEYTIKGKTVKFTEVMYDGTNIYLGYLVSKAPWEEQFSIFNNLLIRVNGKNSGYSFDVDGEQLDDGVFVGRAKLQLFPYPETELPDEIALSILIDGVHAEFQVEKKGVTETFVTEAERRHDDLLIKYKGVSFTPTETTIHLDEIYRNFDKMLSYLVIDDKGRVLKNIGGGGHGTNELYLDTDGVKKAVMKIEESVEPLNEKPISLTIKPYLTRNHDPDEEVTVNTKKWNGEQIRLSQGEMGDIVITDVEQEKGTIAVYLKTLGTDEYSQVNLLSIEDETGRPFYSSSIKQIDIHQYKLTFEDFPAESDITFYTPKLPDNIYLKDLEVTLLIK